MTGAETPDCRHLCNLAQPKSLIISGGETRM